MDGCCLAAAAPEVGVDDELDRVGGGGGRNGDGRARRQESEHGRFDIALKTAADCSSFSL